MSRNLLTLDGLADLRAALLQLPDDLKNEASAIVVAHATAAAQETRQNYPRKTGNLQEHVTVTTTSSGLAVQATVKSAARHASIFEKGTRARYTNRGAYRGKMPEPSDTQQMIPKMVRWRQRMTSQLIALVRRHGFEVSG